jgi:hypothetical protein
MHLPAYSAIFCVLGGLSATLPLPEMVQLQDGRSFGNDSENACYDYNFADAENS